MVLPLIKNSTRNANTATTTASEVLLILRSPSRSRYRHPLDKFLDRPYVVVQSASHRWVFRRGEHRFLMDITIGGITQTVAKFKNAN